MSQYHDLRTGPFLSFYVLSISFRSHRLVISQLELSFP